MTKNLPKHKAKIYTINNQKHEQQIRCSKIDPYEVTSIYNPPEDGPWRLKHVVGM
jgi:hypothetical protein